MFDDLQSPVRSNFHLGAVGDDWSCRASGNTFVLQIGNCLSLLSTCFGVGKSVDEDVEFSANISGQSLHDPSQIGFDRY